MTHPTPREPLSPHLEVARETFTEAFDRYFIGQNTDNKLRSNITDFAVFGLQPTAREVYDAFFESGTHKNLAHLRAEGEVSRHDPLLKYIEGALAARAKETLAQLLPEAMRPERKQHESMEWKKRDLLEWIAESPPSIHDHTYAQQIMHQIDEWASTVVPDAATCRHRLNELNKDFPVLNPAQDAAKHHITYSLARWMGITNDPARALSDMLRFGSTQASEKLLEDVLSRHPEMANLHEEDHRMALLETAVGTLKNALVEKMNLMGMPPEEHLIPDPERLKAALLSLPGSDQEKQALMKDMEDTAHALMPHEREMWHILDKVAETKKQGGMRVIT